jgi:hypothetical protein
METALPRVTVKCQEESHLVSPTKYVVGHHNMGHGTLSILQSTLWATRVLGWPTLVYAHSANYVFADEHPFDFSRHFAKSSLTK